jgi:Response regulator containing CheY-like receiver, AAA-type ATPase, and DNA-binding domains
MSANIRILAIAPYEGMKPLLTQLSKEYSNMDITVLVGDLKKGVEMAQRNFHENYDVIISRGGTAKLIQQSVSLPVIEVNTSAYDILRTLKLSGADTKRVAIVGFSKITEQSMFLKEVLPYTISVHTINSTDEALPVLQRLLTEGYQGVLCDMITYTTARTLGLDAFLITSGIESIRAALDTAAAYCSNNSQLRNENHFLRQLVKVRDVRTVVFTRDGKLFFTSIFNEELAIHESLHKEINNIALNEKRHLMYRQNNLLYSVQAQRFYSDHTEYIAFFITTSKAPMTGNKCGIVYSNSKEVEYDYLNSTYSVINFFTQLNATIDQVNNNLTPVIITGEEGTGKEQIAKAIYLRSNAKSQPFIEINCSLLNDKVWEYLMNHHNSPLFGTECTLFIKDINLLSKERQMELWVIIEDMDIYKRNRVIISSIKNSHRDLDINSMVFIHKLKFFAISLPALRDALSRIESIANLYLNRLDVDNEKQILGITAEALQLLSNYYWPYNYIQFSRVINNLAIISDGPYITGANVKEMLDKELTIMQASANNSLKPLDLSLTLGEINREIALFVLDTFDGNHSKAAKSLGISRTTLWRLLSRNLKTSNET